MSDVVVIGAGVVGASVASSLARRGARVTVLDAGPPQAGSSSANAGHLVPSHVVPFAAPGMVRAGLRSLRARDGAFAVSPRAGLGLAGWLVRFAGASTLENVDRGAPVLEHLLATTIAQVQRLASAGHELDLDLQGLVQVFTDAGSLRTARHEVALMNRLGYPAQELPGGELATVEPCLRGAVGAVLLPRDGRLDPGLLVDALQAEAAARGARFRTGRVLGLRPGRAGVQVATTGGPLPAAQVVVAAGVWTPGLVRDLDLRLPVRPAKGYSITLPDGAQRLRRPLLLMDQRLAVTPLRRGLRITGRFELTRPQDRGVPSARVQALLDRARPVLGLSVDARVVQPWCGLRPATPDGMPVIGRVPGSPAVVVATGHGMLGTTMGPGTGELVAQMLAGEPADLDLAPVSPERFAARAPWRWS